jgi:hypothetical protein
MTSPFNDSELIQIDQPDDLNDSGFDGPWNQDFESTYYIPKYPYFPIKNKFAILSWKIVVIVVIQFCCKF